MSMHADNYLSVLEQATYRAYGFRATTLDEASHWQRRFRPVLSSLLGIDAIAEHGEPPLMANHISTVELPDHIREEWTLETEPGFHVPFFLLRPVQLSGRAPLVITPHGHGKYGKATYVGLHASDAEQEKALAGDREIALQAVRQGYLAIAPDMRGFAGLRRRQEIDADANNSCRHLQMHALLMGRTLIGERVWDVQRIIDWALTRNDVDPDAFVVTGNSGGGTVSLFAAAVDPRIRICIPGSYLSTFRDSIGTLHHCECNYIPGMLRYAEMYDVAGLIAPRPFLGVHGKDDRIYPIEAAQRSFVHLKQIYKVFGAEASCELSVGDGGHRFYQADVWPFIAKHLGRSGNVESA